MSIVLPTTIIPPGTCILRGKSKYDQYTTRRWFAYYGPDKDIKKFCQSKNFIEKYASGGYEYSRVIKPIHVLAIPYIILEQYSADELNYALDIAINMIKYIQNNTLNIENTEGISKDKLIADILELLIPRDAEEDVSEENKNLYKELYSLKQYYSKDHTNPDYSFASFICELGYIGWMRLGTDDMFTQSDEIFFCNINDVNDIYLKNDADCNLSSCNN